MGSVESLGRQARGSVRQAADHPAMDRLARVGLVCRGVLYALIGVLALQVAFGEGDAQADKGGAIATVSALPFGTVLLWIMAVGFAALALWQLSEAVVGTRPTKERAKSAGRVAVYVMVVTALLSMLLAGKKTSEDQKSQDLTKALLDLPLGQILVAAIGLGVVALGVYWLREGLKKRFLKELDTGAMSARARSVMEKLGVAGYLARGAIALLAGIFVVQAAITYDPDRAGGIDATLRAFADTPVGPWLLVLVAGGLVLFAGYCFGEARWRHV